MIHSCDDELSMHIQFEQKVLALVHIYYGRNEEKNCMNLYKAILQIEKENALYIILSSFQLLWRVILKVIFTVR